MSGGRFDYRNDDLKRDLFGWEYDRDSDNYRMSYGDPMQDREVSELVYDVLSLIHDLDWYLSGDTSEETYRKTLKAFKKKWFKTERSERLEKIIRDMFKDCQQKCIKMISQK